MASIKQYVDLDLGNQALRSAALDFLAAAPGSPFANQVYFNTTTQTLEIRNPTNTAWLSFLPGGGVGKDVVSPAATAANTPITVPHTRNTRDVQVEIYRDSAPYDTVLATVERNATTSIQVTFSVAIASNEYRVVIIG